MRIEHHADCLMPLSRADCYVRSLSLYVFCLDEAPYLEVQDADVVYSNKPLVFPVRIYPVKEVAHAASRCTHEVGVVCVPCGKTLDSTRIASSVLNVNKGKVTLHVRKELRVTASAPLLLHTRYKIPLKRRGTRLFYSGAVQPSDYAQAQKIGVRHATKRIVVSAFSSHRPFDVWLRDGTDDDCFPPRHHSEDKKGYHSFERALPLIEMDRFVRARYFSVFIDA